MTFRVRTALDLHHDERHACPLTLGCPYLDAALGGGLRPTGITELAGESATGKTQLCLTLLLTAQLPRRLGGLGGRAIYLNTEGGVLPRSLGQRLRQLACGLVDRLEPERERERERLRL